MPSIRRYRREDWARFIALDMETSRASLAAAPPEQKEAFEQRWPERLKALYQWSDDGPTIDKSALFVLEADDGSYAGHLWVMERDDFFSGVPRLFITTIGLYPDYRGRGWGKLLLERAEEEARARGLSRIALNVEASNEIAIKLYEGRGYRTTRLAMELALE